MEQIEELRRKVVEAEKALRDLKRQLAEAEREERLCAEVESGASSPWKWPLSADEYERYGRQLIIPGIGVEGQQRLKSSRVLIVGAGGLGCPAAAYISGAGVGTIGLADGDVVEASNLHRQIAHSTSRVGTPKVQSAISYLEELNPNPTYQAHITQLTPQNAESIVSRYDLVLDCTDHPTSRYLISDICVLLHKPLVSASAFKTDGQLIVLNNPPAPQGSPVADGGPCYRCVFPKPPPPESVVSCGEGGILGPVVGVMGVLQALEAIKLIAAGGLNHTIRLGQPTTPSLLLFSGASAPPFRSVRMRGRRADCFACSAQSTLTLDTLRSGSLDYVQFCGVNAPYTILQPEERVSASTYHGKMTGDTRSQSILLDVREREHFDICSINGAVNIPIATFLRDNPVPKQDDAAMKPDWLSPDLPETAPIYVVCRVGNDSQVAAKRLKDMGLGARGSRFIGDIEGGMKAWKRDVDPTLPFT